MFRTTFPIPPSHFKINHATQLVSIGSCFADVIGSKLEESKFKVVSNPFGIIYNPISILKSVEVLSNSVRLEEDSFLQHDGVWHNYHLHSQVNARTKEELINIIDRTKEVAGVFLKQAQLVIITLGTAFVYKKVTSKQIVANCHKVPAANFTKELLSVEEITTALEKLVDLLRRLNPEVTVLFSVSPVRHIKDTMPLNTVSKSLLRVACYELQKKHSKTIYFPAFEIMMDDLRDYRFYKDDMIHPTSLAENYIWNKFQETFMDEATQKHIQQWGKLRKALEHKPFQPQSEAHQKFLAETLTQLNELGQYIDLTEEVKNIQTKLQLS